MTDVWGRHTRELTIRRAILAARWAYLVPWAAILCLYYRVVGPRRRFGSFQGASDAPTTVAPAARPRPHSPAPSIIVKAARLGGLPGPLRASCLVRAMAGTRMLKHYGYPAKVVIGVPDETKPGSDDWKAHAWISQGAAQNPPDSATSPFLEIARFET